VNALANERIVFSWVTRDERNDLRGDFSLLDQDLAGKVEKAGILI
jgi:hypothetical protein